MKSFLILLFVLSSFSVFSQDLYEKYNDLQNRYEYYNSNNELVGYKIYNDLQGRWEYHKVNQGRKGRERNIYGKPISTDNTDLVREVLSAKQGRYDNNVNALQNHIDKLSNQLRDYSNTKQRIKASEMFSDVIENFNRQNNNIDYSNSSATNNVMNYFTREYNKIIKYVNNMNTTTYNKRSSSNKNSRSVKFESGLIKTAIDIYLRSEPNPMGSKIYKCPPNSIVEVIDDSGEIYFKVVVDGYSGYISKKLLKRKW